MRTRRRRLFLSLRSSLGVSRSLRRESWEMRAGSTGSIVAVVEVVSWGGVEQVLLGGIRRVCREGHIVTAKRVESGRSVVSDCVS